MSPRRAPKPRLRGYFHLAGFLATPAAAAALILAAEGPRATRAVIVYAVAMALTLGVSAAYHIPNWRPRARAQWRHADHAAIFVLIFGTYLPICRLGLPAAQGDSFLLRVGLACAGGALLAPFEFSFSKVLRALVYLAIGWSGVTLLPAMWAALGPANVVLFAAGGIIYSVGALIYAAKRPNPFPATFGHHEIFHVLVLVGCLLHYIVVWRVLAAPHPV